MALLQNTAEANVPAGTAVTSANSGGAAGDSLGTTGTTGTITFDATAAMRGTLGYRVAVADGAAATMQWNNVAGASNAFATRFKLKVPALPTAAAQPLVAWFNTAAGTRLFALNLDTAAAGSHLFFTAQSFTDRQGPSTVASLVAGRAYQVEVYGNNGPGSQLHLRLFEADGITPVPGGSLDVTSPSIDTLVVSSARFGRPLSTAGALTVYFDDLAFQTGSSTPIGPVTTGTVAPGATGKATGKANPGGASIGAEVPGDTAVALATATPIIPVQVDGDTPTAAASAPAGTAVWPHLQVDVTPEPDADPPRVRISIADTRLTPATSIVISRRDPDGRTTRVRTFDDGPLTLSGGLAVIYDYEAPYGQDVVYSTSITGGPSVPARLDVPDPWLIHLGVPTRSVRIAKVVSHDEDVRDANRGLFTVLERSDPIPVTSGARSSPSGVLTVQTLTDADRQALGLLLEDSSVVLLNVPAGKGWGIATDYISIGNTAPKRIVNYGREPRRNWPLPYQVVARPAGGTQAGRTWDTVKAAYATWDAVKADVDTWAQLVAPTT